MDTNQTWKSGKAFYYPYIEIQDVNWLKLALLYWDGIRRILPADACLKDHPEVCEAVDAGVFEGISPVDYRQAASKRFLEKFKPLIPQLSTAKKLEQILDAFSSSVLPSFEDEHGDALIRIFSEADQKESEPIWNVQNFGNVYAVDSIYASQSVGEAGSLLQRFRLKDTSNEDSDTNIYRVNAFVGGFYRLCLATEMSTRIGIPLVTDRSQIANCGEYVSQGKRI